MGANTGMEIPYIIKFSIKDDDIRKSLSKIDWEEELGIDKGKIITDALKSDAKTASDAIERELGGTSINWKKVLGADLFQQLEIKITKQAREIRDSLKGWIDAGDMKRVSEAIDLITQLGQSFREMGGDFNTKSFFTAFNGMIDTVDKVEKKVASLEGTLKRIQSTFGVTFNDKGGIAKTSSGIERIGKALLVMGADKSAITNLKGIESELNKIESKSTIKIKADVDEGELSKFWNEQIDALSQFDDLTIDDLIKDLDSYKDKAKELIPIISNLLAIDEKAKKRGFGSFIKEAIDYGDLGFDEFYDRKEARKAMSDMMSTLQEEVDKGSKKVSEAFEKLVSGINEIEVDLTLTQKTKDDLIKSINDYVKELNEGSQIEPVKIKAIFDRIRKENPEEDVPKIKDTTKEKKDKVKQKKYGDEVTSPQVQRVKSKIEKEIDKLQAERDALQKEFDKQDAAIREDKRGRKSAGQTIQKDLLAKHIEEYEKTIEAYKEIQQLMDDPQSAAEITKEWDNIGNSLSILETKQKSMLTKTKTWKTKMIEALSITAADLDGKFDFEDAGKALSDAIQEYLDDPNNKIRLQIDTENIATQIKQELEREGINLGGGGSGGNVHFDAKELGSIVASAMNSVLTGAPMPSFEDAPQEQQTEIVEKVDKAKYDAPTMQSYVKWVDESTIGVKTLIGVLKEFAQVATDVKFDDDGNATETAPKYFKEISETLAKYGIDASTIKGATDQQILQIIRDALFTQRSDLTATGDFIPALIKEMERKNQSTENDRLVGALRHAFEEVLVNNGVNLSEGDAVFKRQRNIDFVQDSVQAGGALKALKNVRGGLYPGKDKINVPKLETIQRAIDIFESQGRNTDDLQLLKMAREELGDKTDDESINRFRMFSDEFWNNTQKVNDGLEILHSGLKARVTLNDNEIFDIDSPAKAAKLLKLIQSGRTIIDAEVYGNHSTQAIGGVGYAGSGRQQKAEERKMLRRDGYNPYVTKAPEDFGKKWKYKPLESPVVVKEFEKKDIVVNGTDVDFDKAIQKTQTNIAEGKSKLQETETKIQELDARIKRQETDVKRKRTQLNKINVDTTSIDTTDVDRGLKGQSYKSSLLKRIGKGELLSTDDKQYNEHIAELYPDIYKKMQDINKAVEERKLKEEQLQKITNLTTEEAKRRLQRFEADKQLADRYKDPENRKYMSAEQRSEAEQATNRVNNKIAQSYAKLYQDFLNKPKATQTALKSGITRLKNKETNQRSVVQEWAKSEIDKMPQAMEEIQNKAKSLMSKFKQQIDGLYKEAMSVGTQLEDPNISSQKRTELLGYLNNVLTKLNDVQGEYEDFAKKVNLKPINLSKQRQGDLTELSSKYAEDMKSAANKRQQAVTQAENDLRSSKRYKTEKESERKQLENEIKSEEALVVQYNAQKAVQPQINKLKADELRLQGELQDLIRNSGGEETQAIKDKRIELQGVKNELQAIIDKLRETTGGFIDSKKTTKVSKEEIRDDAVDYINYYDRQIQILQDQKKEYEKKKRKLTEREETVKKYGTNLSKGEAATELKNTKEDWAQEYVRSSLDVRHEEDKLKQDFEQRIADIEKSIRDKYEREIKAGLEKSGLLPKSKKYKSKEEKQAAYQKARKDFLSSESGQTVTARFNKEVEEAASIARQEYYKQLDQMRKEMSDKFITSLKPKKGVLRAEYEQIVKDADGVESVQNLVKEEDIVQKILDRIKREKQVLKDSDKPDEIDKKIDRLLQLQQDAQEYAQLGDEALIDPVAVKEQNQAMSEYLANDEKLQQKRKELATLSNKDIKNDEVVKGMTDEKSAIDAVTTSIEKLKQLKREDKQTTEEYRIAQRELGLVLEKYLTMNPQKITGSGKDGNLTWGDLKKEDDKLANTGVWDYDPLTKNRKRGLQNEIDNLEAKQQEKLIDIDNRQKRVDEERALQEVEDQTLTKEEQLAQALKRQTELQDKLTQSTIDLNKAQEEYNKTKSADAHQALEKAIAYQEKLNLQLTNTETRINRLTGEVEKEKGATGTVGTTASGSVQGGLVGAIVSAIKESMSNVDTQGVATEETLRKIYGLLGGDYQPEGGVSRNKKGAKTAYDILKEAMSGFDMNMSEQEKQDFYKSFFASKEIQDAAGELIIKDNSYNANNKEIKLINEYFKILDTYMPSYPGTPAQKDVDKVTVEVDVKPIVDSVSTQTTKKKSKKKTPVEAEVAPADTTVKSTLNAKELNQAAYDQTKGVIEKIKDEKAAVDAITESVERLKQLTNENKQDTEEYIIEQRKLGTILAKSYFPMNPQGVKGTGKDGALKWEDLKANDATLKKLGVWDYNPLTSNKALEALVGGDKPAKQDNNQKELETLDSRINTLNSKLEQILPLIEANPEAKGIAEEVKAEIVKLEADRQKLIGGAQGKTDNKTVQKQDKKTSDTKDFKAEVKALITEIDKHKAGSKEQEPLQKALHELIKEWRASGKLGEKGATGKQLADALAKQGIKNIDPKKYALTGNQLNKLFPELKTTSAKQDTPVVSTKKSTPITSPTSVGGLLGIMQNELAKDETLHQILNAINGGWRDNVRNGLQQIIDADGDKEVSAVIDSKNGKVSGYVKGNEDSISATKLKILEDAQLKPDTRIHTHGDSDDKFFSPEDFDQFATDFTNGITNQVLKNKNHVAKLDMTGVKDIDGLLEALKNTKHTFVDLEATAKKFGATYTHKSFEKMTAEGLQKFLGLNKAKGGDISESEASSDVELPKDISQMHNRIQKYKAIFEYAQSNDAGYLLKDGDKQFQASNKILEETIQKFKEGKATLDELRAAYTKTADEGRKVNNQVNQNKRLYAGTNELRSAQRQRDKISGQYDVDFDIDVDKTKVNEEDMSLLELYEKKYQDLITLYDKYAKNRSLNDTKHQEKLREESALVQKLGRKYISEAAEQDKLKDLKDNSSTFINSKGKEIKTGGFHAFSDTELVNKTAAMRAYAEALYGAEAANFKLDKKTMTLNGTIRENNKVVHDVAIKYNEAAQGAYAFEKAERESLSGFPAFMRGLREKTKAISQYLVSMTSIYRIFGEIRKGIQYVRDIDLALTELKKVTDETDATYRKFLDTASKTAAKVGSTIKEIVSSTADFARLGYTLKEAATFAESAQILMNVSEFTDVSRATDTLISAVQAFGYTAETSMEVVDLLNMIGNNYAISTSDLAQSLTKSSASLVAAGGNLAEAAALTATANKIVQDADSVGK